MKNIIKIIYFLFLGAIFLTGCSGDEANLNNEEKHITEEMDEVISNYIVQKYSNLSSDTEKQFEVHKVYGTSELGGIITVYIWSYYGGFNQATGLENQAGHSLPAVVQLSQKGENYSVIDYKEPQDGSLYQSSLKRMFPEKYLKLLQQDSGNMGDLQKEMDKKVNQWLEQRE